MQREGGLTTENGTGGGAAIPAAQRASVATLLHQRAAEHPDAPFVWFRGRSWTWAQVAFQGRALACALQGLGVEKGDRVAVLLPNRPELVLTLFACAELGAIIVPLNPGYAPRELHYVLRNTSATVVVSAERHDGADYLQLFESMLAELPALQYLATVGEEDLWYDDRIFQFEDLVSSGRVRPLVAPELHPDRDPFAVLYTSGTMGREKGVTLSHANLVWVAEATAAALELGASDVTLCSVPLFNIFGLGAALLPALASGSALVLQERFDAAGALELMEARGVTVHHGVPTMFVLLLREPDLTRRDLSSLRTGMIAGAPVGAELVERIRRELNPGLEIAYGSTETASAVTITRPDDPSATRTRTVGRPLDGVSVRILDGDDREVAAGTEGELAVRSPGVMLGYWRQPAATADALTPDGFLRTGDLAAIDAEGFLRIAGRKSDVIVRGGYTVHPRELEDHLRSHPAVLDAMVVGLPNEVLGELICACVRPEEGAITSAEELRDFCRSGVAEYKVPDLVHFEDEFPTAPSGKTRRAELARRVRARAAEAAEGGR